ncbi:hypothetical protein [Aquimarina sp. SS2-1]|uniref:hypothetical protein n=1 Tax=Aquimarina besae TaxID=3342247 RepID=UPI00366E2FFD
MEKSIKSFYKIEFPVFSFDTYKDNLIALIYQSAGENKLSIRAMDSKEELFFYDLNSSSLHVKIRFLKDPNEVVFFNHDELGFINIKNKKVYSIRKEVHDVVIKEDKMIAISNIGEIYFIERNNEPLSLGQIENYIPIVHIDGTQTIDFSYETGQVVIACMNKFYCVNYKNLTSPIRFLGTLDISQIRQLVYNDLNNSLICIITEKNKLNSLKIIDDDYILKSDTFLTVENCASVKIIKGTYNFIMGSSIGYLTIVNEKSLSLLFSQRVHMGVIRDILIKGNMIFTSGDDGNIVKTYIPSKIKPN